MRQACAGTAASCPPERRDVVQEVVRKIGRTRRAIIFLGVSIALLFLASVLLPTEPSAQTTSPEGKIVFVKEDGDIWVMDADGTNQTNLTNTPDTIESQPAWSPDGTKIAFTRLDADFAILGDIWVMDADGSNQINLTPTAPDANNLDEYQPSWDPSGTQLAFVREVRKEDLPGQIISEQDDIFVMDANGENATNITQTEADERDPAWSPDGAKIAFSGVRAGGEEILTMDPDGQNEEILTGDGSDAFDVAPDWSPDGTKVVFQKQSQELGCCEPPEIWAVNRDGSGDTNLTNDPSNDTGPSWSPDGSEITFSSDRLSTENPAEPDIYAMPAPTTLPPPSGETASITTSQDSGGARDFAASDVLLQAASAQTTVRRLTTDGGSTEPDWADAGADTQAPRVTSTSPAAGVKDVARGTNVRATFSERMDPASITKATFKLFRCSSTTSTNCTIQITNVTMSKSTDGLRATLNPYGTSSTLLAPSTKYKAVVTTGAKDQAGNALDQNATTSGNQQKVWFFTVGTRP
jgi:Tol biopolymer transport system component